MSRHNTAKSRVKNNRKDNTYELSQALVNNYRAWEEGPQKRKTWSKHDLKMIKPLTITQEDLFHAFYSNYQIVGYGSAGTGKSFISLWLALNEVFNKDTPQTRIIIVRSNVPTREVGHLPGTYEEKLSLYETPYRDILEELIGKRSTYDDMKAAGLIEFIPTSFIRGQTWNDAVIIVDEFQSMNFHELSSVITRKGKNSRLVLLGDTKQDDLQYKKNDVSGAAAALRVLNEIDSVAMIKFTSDDIVRDEFVKAWIIACEKLGL